MAKKGSKFNKDMANEENKFNFAKTPFANEIGEDMDSVEKIQPEITSVPFANKKRSERTKNDMWTLVQCRLPKDLHRRMSVYNLNHEVSKNDFIIEAVKLLLEKVGG